MGAMPNLLRYAVEKNLSSTVGPPAEIEPTPV